MSDSKNEMLQIMSNNPWFGRLPLAERRAMLAVAELSQVRAGEMLYRKGDPVGGFFGLLSGAFKISTLGEDGREGILSVVEQGNWFGEAALLDGLPRPHDATAMQSSEVLVIRRADFARLMRRNAFARAMAGLVCSRVRALYGLVEDSMLRSTRTRVARRLLALTRGDATLAPVARTSVLVSQDALAMMLGITRQTMSRELRDLVRAGIVKLSYCRIDIVSMEALELRGATG